MPTRDMAPFAGYRRLRASLDLAEERPGTSLWSVLKHSIGKDLMKISFPVFFNEPTSMLQWIAEDMEFSECCKWLSWAVGERLLMCFLLYGQSMWRREIGIRSGGWCLWQCLQCRIIC